MSKEFLLNEIKVSKTFLDRTTEVLDEADSTLIPVDGMMNAAQQIAHIAQTVDWFVEGVFGEGFDMDFEEHFKLVLAINSLAEAQAWCDRSFETALKTIEGKSEEELQVLTPADSIMGESPIFAVLAGIVDHTAHHRGALSVYIRLAGKVPVMPYM